ncbi:MAG: sugar phosphate nucleotidyltransferase [Elusimicrobiota bacterium]
MNAIILLGGLGTRLRPLTILKPKALLPILNKPFLSYQFDLLRRSGIKNVVLAAGMANLPFKKEFLALGGRGLNVKICFEPFPLGTGGAIKFGYEQLLKYFPPSAVPVFVMNGDVFINLDIKSFFKKHLLNKAVVSIALTKVKDPSQFGVIILNRNSRIMKFVEKPKKYVGDKINAGAYMMSSEWLNGIRSNTVLSVEKDLFPLTLKEEKPMFGFQINGYWNDIGTHTTYLKAHRDLSNGKSFMGKGSHVHSTATLENSVLFENVLIGKETVIRNSIIASGVEISNNCCIENAVLAEKTKIMSYSKVIG